MTDIPDALARYIVGEIRRGRSAAGLTQEAFGRAANFSASHVSSVENGTRALTMDFVMGADRALKTGGLFERLVLTLAAPAWLREWIEIEREAVVLRSFENVVIPGLLQTEAYARALFNVRLLTPEQGQQQLTSRLERQAILGRDEPPQLVAVLDALVLRRPIGGREVMREQLAHLLKLSDGNPLVRVHVVPEETGAYIGLGGPFVLATLPDNTDVAYLDNQLKGQVVDRAPDVMQVGQAWDAILGCALSAPQSTELISRMMDEWN